MRLLNVRHVTTYRYREKVGLGEHRMMFRPRESHDLRLVTTRLAITPAPSRLRWLHDVFDNSVAVASFAGTTSELRFESNITLEHTTTAAPDYALEAQARAYPFTYAADELPDLVRALARQCPEDDIGDFVAGILAESGFPAGSPSGGPIETMALLRTITRTIRESFTYARRDEKGVQRPSETLRRGRGSCRDFALLMMETARSLGLAARFVSGYIVVSDAYPRTTVGGGATHAWLQVYLPGAGWVDFDPTNSGVGNRNLIRVAFAWDPEQAVPLWGTYFGARDAAIAMEVEVSVAEETLAA
jgi:transglutaminase-like putative cysteine protease